MAAPDGDLEALINATKPGGAAYADASFDVVVGTAETPIGPLLLAITERGLAVCCYESEEAMLPRVTRLISPRLGRDRRRLDPVRRELDAYFAGRLQSFATPVDLRLTSGFGRIVLRSLLDVPYGTTTTYDELAARIGHHNAVRAVANALATNPVCVVLPCHRVVPSGFPADPSVGGYAGGADAKLYLLTLEEYAPRRRPAEG
ncbi:methylated-DNA--[protein]-cysteine S-methyltransferase [Allonocardiopsis opalescens]|uniref:Methylated-DNA-[protein]-cysteine S-methyltransferase n=1 Tax=Allonocardiopsis opalescens TaxID=1144618 RepID=A0A2T0Q751_9ACTN|nr:methylated-DNA--[protein]-cysteine S-methyltransferase [Allonocardiopsis opalescens]PRX99611.1 methylated-DNA-[protein]-cysteine S-methyltransferase [Allonocardiopsis opalescens]